MKTLNATLFIAMIMMTATVSRAQQSSVLATVSKQMSQSVSVNGLALGSENAELGKMISDLRITSIKKAFPSSRQRSLQQVVEITCDCDVNDLYKAVAEESDYFQRVEMVENFELMQEPNDYNLAGYDYALNLINAQGAWDITHGDSSVVIAITDGGFYYNHEELVGKYTYVSANPFTYYSHGTAVANAAAGNTNNLIGKSSIGYNSSLQLRAMTYEEVLQATYSGAKIINMSWASGCYFNSYYQSVIDEAYNNGSILIASAGNGSTCGGPSNLVYPAAFDHVIAVSSVGPMDNHERFPGNPSSTHQHNQSVDICAPGYDVLLSYAPGTYGAVNGTSFASPIVSGTVALMLSVNPCLSFEQVEEILKSTAVNIDNLNPAYAGQLGSGRLDAGAAVYAAAHYGTFPLNGEQTFECSTMEQSITLDPSTILAPFTIQWNTGDTTLNLNSVNPGHYEAIVRDAAGCLGVFSTDVDTLNMITVTADITHPLCYNAASGSIELVAAGGHGNFSYSWSNGSQGKNVYNLSAGTYEVTVTDGKGCSVSEEFILNNPNELNATIEISNNNYISEGYLNVSVTGGFAPYTYSWNTGSTEEDIETNEVGFYEVLVIDANGCMTSANGFLTSNQTTEINADLHEVGVSSEGMKNETTGTASEGTASVESMEAADVEVNAYPNPSAGAMTITWEGAEIRTMIITNMMGQIISNDTVSTADGKVVIEQLPAGQYMVSLFNNKGNKITKKVTFQ
jgi:hypothetical protein